MTFIPLGFFHLVGESSSIRAGSGLKEGAGREECGFQGQGEGMLPAGRPPVGAGAGTRPASGRKWALSQGGWAICSSRHVCDGPNGPARAERGMPGGGTAGLGPRTHTARVSAKSPRVDPGPPTAPPISHRAHQPGPCMVSTVSRIFLSDSTKGIYSEFLEAGTAG